MHWVNICKWSVDRGVNRRSSIQAATICRKKIFIFIRRIRYIYIFVSEKKAGITDQFEETICMGNWIGSHRACFLNTPGNIICGRTVLQYCCCLIAILTVWKTFMKISHRKRRRVKNDREVIMCLPVHDITVIIFATFKMCDREFS